MIFAFYGSLRKGQYNNTRFSLDNEKIATYLGTHTIDGFGLFDAGIGYPFAAKKDGAKLVVDLFKIHHHPTADSIHRMEKGAGYNIDTITVEDKQATIYPYPIQEGDKGFKHIPDGDWAKVN